MKPSPIFRIIIVILFVFKNKIAKEIGSENVLVIASYRRIRDFLLFKRMNQLADITIYQTQSLYMPLEQLEVPFLFLLSQDMKAHLIFFPDSDNQMTLNYYKIIKERFFRD